MSFRPLIVSASLFLAFGAGFFASQTFETVNAALKGSATFSDVVRDSYYDDAVGEMFGLGIIQGYDSGRFGPNDPVTRGQIAVLMKRLRDELKGIRPAPASSSSSSSSVAQASSSSSRSSSSSSASTTAPTVEGAGSIRFTKSEISLSESVSNLSISVLRENGSEGSVSVDYETSNGSAVSGEDFTESKGTVAFKEGETNKTIIITLKNDSSAESSESFTVTLKSPKGGAGLGSPHAVTVTIFDNESAGGGQATSTPTSGTGSSGGFSFSATEYAVAENEGSITITVERSTATSSASVKYATNDGTASSSDYTAASGTLDFAVGETSKTFVVSVTDNSSITGNKTVNLTLSNPTGNTKLGTNPTSKIAIEDNEMSSFVSGSGTVKFKSAEYEVIEGSLAAIIISRSGGHKNQVTVDYETTGGSAVVDLDYTKVQGTLTFKAGETEKVFFVSTLDDELSEDEELVNLTLKNITGGASLGTSTASLAIQQ